MALSRFLPPLNGATYTNNIEKPYVDDIFDPLFNTDVTSYYRNLYGTLGAPIAGYASMLENALTGNKGILGPGMGILSTFGRSMDKAADPFLGVLTEGVNTIGMFTKGNTEAPENPFKRIFVDDYNYEGTKLMAAAGNAMARLAGTQTPLDESDFQSLGDRAAGTVIDLATDPGVFGSQLARLNKGTMVGKVGDALNSYDNFVAKVAGNMAFPGAQSLLKAGGGSVLAKLKQVTGAADAAPYKDFITNTNDGAINTTASIDPAMQTIQDMADDVVNKSGINFLEDPELWKTYEDITKQTYSLNNIVDENYLKYLDDSQIKYTQDIENFKKLMESEQTNITKELSDLVNNNSYLFGTKITKSSLDDVIDSLDLTNERDYERFWEIIEDNMSKPKDIQDLGDLGKGYEYLKYMEDDILNGSDNFILEDLKDTAKNYLTTYNSVPSRYVLIPKRNMLKNDQVKLFTDIVNYHFGNFLMKHPEGFDVESITKPLTENTSIKYVPTNVMQSMHDYIEGISTVYNKKKHTTYKTSKINTLSYNNYDNLVKSLYDYKDVSKGSADFFKEESLGFIPWVRQNEQLLGQTDLGYDLIELADNLENDLFKNTGLFEQITRSAENPKEISLMSPYKELNKLLSSNEDLSPKTIEYIKNNLEHFILKDNKTGFKYTKNSTSENLNVPFKKLSQQIVAPVTEFNISKTSNIIKDLSPTDFAETVTRAYTQSDYRTFEIYEEVFKDFKNRWNISDDNVIKYDDLIKSVGTPQEKTLFAQLEAAQLSEFKNKLKISRGVENLDSVKHTKILSKTLKEKYASEPQKVLEYLDACSRETDEIIKGKDMLPYLIGSGGTVSTKLKIGQDMSKEEISKLFTTIKNNANKINTHGNIIVPFTKKQGDTIILGYRFNTENLNIKKDVSKIYSLLGKDLQLEDMLFFKGTNVHPKGYEDLDTLFLDIRTTSEDLATKLGFSNFQPNYIKYAMDESDKAKNFWKEYNNMLGNDDTKLSKIVSALQDLNIAKRGQFGTIEFKRSNLGAFKEYLDGYSTDLEFINSSTFTKGMLDNSNFNTFVDLWLTDNFKVQNNFKDVATLKKVLHARDGADKYTGNLNNLELVKPIYTESGKLKGFKRWNKLQDADLAKAYADPDTILIPTTVLSPLDFMCKKNAKFSNKIITFINKYITVPFKFGTLANPGFLVGNIQDAYFKQASTMATKYGTSMTDELSNVAMAMRQTTVLNNQFADVFDSYRKFLTTAEAQTDPIFSKYASEFPTVTSYQILNDPEAAKAWLQYIDTKTSDSARDVAKFYMFLNNHNNMLSFKNTELADLKALEHVNEYAGPTNIVERIFYGSPSKTKIVKNANTGVLEEVKDTGFRTWGLFLNNPVSNKILKSSNDIESLMRTSSILNDLKHRGWTEEKINDILKLPSDVEAKTYQDLRISMQEAVNTMNTANFDYNNVSELMNKASYILPFPTFYLKNLAYWAEVFTDHPQLIDNIISVQEGMWSGKETEDEFMAEAKGRGAVPIGQQGNKHLTGIVKQSPYTSMFGAFNAVNDPVENLAFRTNPILRPVTRHLQDSEDVKYRPYNSNVFQKNIKKGDKEFSELAYMFHQLNPYERIINTFLRTPTKVSKGSYQLSDFLPSIFQPDFSKK